MKNKAVGDRRTKGSKAVNTNKRISTARAGSTKITVLDNLDRVVSYTRDEMLLQLWGRVMQLETYTQENFDDITTVIEA